MQLKVSGIICSDNMGTTLQFFFPQIYKNMHTEMQIQKHKYKVNMNAL